jgi:hypothetical protein
MRKIVLTGTAVAVAAAFGITVAAPASTSTTTEHFSFIDVSNQTGIYSAIATGEFTAGGTVVEGASGKGTIRLSGGTIAIDSKSGTSKSNTNPATCLDTDVVSGTYTLTSGTGAYKGITGSGKFTFTATAVRPMIKRKCSTTAKPTASQRVVTASGPVSKR